jgi:hypothetical protein
MPPLLASMGGIDVFVSDEDDDAAHLILDGKA